MAWNPPAVFVSGATLLASQLNQMRDSLKAIGDPWTAFAPAWSGSTTNPAIGNGTITGGYSEAGKMINFWVQIVMGSTTTYGSGQWRIAAPVPESAHRWLFQGAARDVSALGTYPIYAERAAAGLFTIKADPTTAGDPLRNTSGGTVPFTWATTDELFIAGTYEAL